MIRINGDGVEIDPADTRERDSRGYLISREPHRRPQTRERVHFIARERPLVAAPGDMWTQPLDPNDPTQGLVAMPEWSAPSPARIEPKDMIPGQRYELSWDDCCTSGTITGTFVGLGPQRDTEGRWCPPPVYMKAVEVSGDFDVKHIETPSPALDVRHEIRPRWIDPGEAEADGMRIPVLDVVDADPGPGGEK